jgi:2-oxoisovalerate dehydrogenase E1 component
MLRTAMALARIDGRVVFFLEPIALYRTRDLVEEGDDGWLDPFPAPGSAVELGRARVYDENGGDNPALTIVSWANGLWRSLRAAHVLREQHGVGVRVVDLRWLLPLDLETVLEEASKTGRVLIVDEGRRTGGVSEALVTGLLEGYADGTAGALPRIERYCGEDTFIPLGPAWGHVLPNEDGIVQRALALAASPAATVGEATSRAEDEHLAEGS